MAKYDYFEQEKTPSAAVSKRGKTSGRGVRLFSDAAEKAGNSAAASAVSDNRKKRRASRSAKTAGAGAVSPPDALAPPQPASFGTAPSAPDSGFSAPLPDLAPPAGAKPAESPAKAPKQKGKKPAAPAPQPGAPLSGTRQKAGDLFARIAGVFGVQDTGAGSAPSVKKEKTLKKAAEKAAPKAAEKPAQKPAGTEKTAQAGRSALSGAGSVFARAAGALHLPLHAPKTAAGRRNDPAKKQLAPKHPAGTFDFLGDDLAPPAASYTPPAQPVLPDLPQRRPAQPEKKAPSPKAEASAKKSMAVRPSRAKKADAAAPQEAAGAKGRAPKLQNKRKPKTPAFLAARRQKAQERRAREARLLALENRLHREAPKKAPAQPAAPAAETAQPAAVSHAAAKHGRLALIVLSCLAVVAAAALIAGFSLSISSGAKRSSSFAQSSATVCTEYLAAYGEGEITDFSEDTYDLYSLQGFFSARRIDFDHDGNEELLLLYSDEGRYCADIWGLDDDGAFSRLHTMELSAADTGEVWLVLLKTGTKYYLGAQSGSMESDITFYRLKGSAFVEAVGTGKYNSEKRVYRRLGRNITERLEFLKVTSLTKRQAEEMLNRLQDMIGSFGAAGLAAQSNMTEEQQRAQAYLDTIDAAAVRFGRGALSDDGTYLQGVCVARLVDFDGDGTEELLLVYAQAPEGDEVPHYVLEVYRCTGTAAALIFTNETLVTPSYDQDARLVMLQQAGEETRICAVTRDVSDSAGRYTARLYRLTDDTFSLLYSAEVEDTYGTKRYSIDGSRVSAEEFSENGTSVPYFYKAEDTPDDSYTLLHVAGDDRDALEETLAETDRVAEALRAELD